MQFRQHQRDAHFRTARLLVLFVLLLAGLALAINLLLAVAYKLLMPLSMGFPALFFETNTGLVLLFVVGGCLVESQRLRDGGGPRVAHWLGGHEVQPGTDDATERRLLNVVDEMALASGQPVPRVFVMRREDAINAFVAGWTPEDLVMCVTRGALDRLTRNELQGLVAHEFGHIKEDDLPLSMRVLSLVWGLSLVHGYGQSLMAADDKGRVGPLSWLVGLVFTACGWLGWMAGRVLQASVSRQREFLADACAVQFTRSRDGLGNVLRKLWHDQQVLAGRMRHPAAAMVSYLLMHESGSGSSCMSSHPRLSERIRRVCGTILPPLPAPLLRLEAVEPRHTTDTARAMAVAALSPRQSGEQARQDLLHTAREALARLQHLSGPTERRLAIIALMMDIGNERERMLWEQLATGLHDPQRILDDVSALQPNRRVPEFERLTATMVAEPIEQRRALVESARDLLRADGRVSPRERLWWLALRHRVNERQNRQAYMRPMTGQGHDLQDLREHELAHVTALTTYLARFIPVDESRSGPSGAGQAWFKGVMARCKRPQAHETPLGGSPDADALMHALAGVQELSWMTRPLLLKAWVEEAVNHSAQGVLSDETADALRLVAGLIDAPLPPMLDAHYPAKPAARP